MDQQLNEQNMQASVTDQPVGGVCRRFINDQEFDKFSTALLSFIKSFDPPVLDYKNVILTDAQYHKLGKMLISVSFNDRIRLMFNSVNWSRENVIVY